jgi:serine/threonine protein kinase
MATVYLAVVEREGGFQRQVAIKMIHGTEDSDRELAGDLLREAKLAARIRHPNVVPVLDVGEDPRGLYLVMDYIEGDNVAGLRRTAARLGESVPVDIALRIATDALAGLHAAHELLDNNGQLTGVVHRDFSPHNILVGTDGVTRLTDFGIAKIAMTAGHTRTGRIKGKIAYMSPEQARGVKVDRRCDIWAAGVVVWELLTGERLHTSEDEIGLLLKIVGDEPPRLKDVRPELPAALDEALASALTRDLDQRCATADELRRKLVMSHPIADTASVAQWVERIAEPKLRARHEKIAEIRRLREAGERTGEISAPTETSFAPAQEAPVWQPSEASGETRTRTSGVSQSLARSTAPAPPRSRRRAVVIGASAGLVLGLVAVISFVVGNAKDSEPTDPSAVAQTVTEVAPESSAPSAETRTVESETATFVVRANSEISALRVAGKPIPLASPVDEVQLPALPKPGDSVEATSTDGRKVRGVVASDSVELTLAFADSKPPARSGKPPSAPTTKPTGKSTGTNPPFATNPYLEK